MHIIRGNIQWQGAINCYDTQEIVPQKDDSILFEAVVAGSEEMKFRVMNWGAKAEMIGPESLREEIRVEAEGMAEKYTKPGVCSTVTTSQTTKT